VASRNRTSTTCFAIDGGYWTAFEVWPARCSRWHLFINVITSAIGWAVENWSQKFDNRLYVFKTGYQFETSLLL